MEEPSREKRRRMLPIAFVVNKKKARRGEKREKEGFGEKKGEKKKKLDHYDSLGWGQGGGGTPQEESGRVRS